MQGQFTRNSIPTQSYGGLRYPSHGHAGVSLFCQMKERHPHCLSSHREISFLARASSSFSLAPATPGTVPSKVLAQEGSLARANLLSPKKILRLAEPRSVVAVAVENRDRSERAFLSLFCHYILFHPVFVTEHN